MSTTSLKLNDIAKEISLQLNEKTHYCISQKYDIPKPGLFFFKILENTFLKLYPNFEYEYQLFHEVIFHGLEPRLLNDALLRLYLIDPELFHDEKLDENAFNAIVQNDQNLLLLLAQVFQNLVSAFMCLYRFKLHAVDLVNIAVVNFETEVRISPAGSDRHNHGDISWIVSLQNKKRYVYKPRTGQPELIWQSICQEVFPDRDSLRIVCGGNYHFVSFVEQAVEYTTKKYSIHLEHFGSLIALAHILNMNDIHEENVIAGESGFQIIDCETIFHPGLSPLTTCGVNEADAVVFKHNQDSIFELGVLPFTMEDRFGNNIEKGGLSKSFSKEEDRIEFVKSENSWLPKKISGERIANKNFPQNYGSERNPLFIFSKNFVDGYVAGIRKILHNKEKLISIIESFSASEHLQTRLIIRNTKYYDFVIRNHNIQLISGGHVDAVGGQNAPYISQKDQSLFNYIEQACLKEADVPRFVISPSSTKFTEVSQSQNYINLLSSESGKERCIKKIKNIERNINLFFDDIERYFLYQEATHYALNQPMFETQIERAEHAFSCLAANSLQVGGSVSWRQLHSVGDGKNFGFRHVPPGLYEGKAGILLALAAAKPFIKDETWCSLVTNLLHEMQTTLAHISGEDFALEYGKGAYAGAAGMVYSALYIKKYTDISICSTDIINFFKTINDYHFRDDAALDVASGNAGVILSLWPGVSLGGREADFFKSESVKIGDILFSQENLRTNFTKKGYTSPEFGFAHGNSGIALAAIRLFQITNKKRFAEYALDLLRSEFNKLANTNNTDGRFCRGASGLTMVLKEAVLQLRIYESELNYYLRHCNSLLSNSLPTANDTLCCGSGGVELCMGDIATNKRSTFTYGVRQLAGTLKDNPSLFRGCCSYIISHAIMADAQLGNILIFE